MEIRKRSGQLEAYDPQKIIEAIRKSFRSREKTPSESELAALLASVERRLKPEEITVEQIQDEVERSLMEQGYYDVAKAYILYRDHRTKLRQSRQMICDTCLLYTSPSPRD